MSYDHVQNNGSILDVLVELGIWQILCEVCHQGNEIYSICYNIKMYIYIYIIKKHITINLNMEASNYIFWL